MDPLYTAERASRERVWASLLQLGQETRQNPSKNPPVEGVRQPLSIIQVERVDESETNELLELSYRPDRYGVWLCVFCGMDMEDHSWSSFDSKENSVIVPKRQPVYCTLHKLLDRLAQDFFPGRTVSVDWNAEARFDFYELDELSTVMSTTRIELQNQESKSASFQAMNVNQQLEALKGWLEICERGSAEDHDEIHVSCQKHKDLAIPAKRVLDLADAVAGIVQIVETVGLRGRYIALSHCWGHPKRYPLMTTLATLKDRMSGIAVFDLPRSFRDAITVCLHLQIQYLWIDCLCIVQDDSAEWLAEAENMAEIYQESYLTIAATRAQNSQHGFLFDFADDTIQYEIVANAPRDRDTSEHRKFHATFRIDHEFSKSESRPLDNRAWCLQEWYLPKRVIEFCLNDIRLMCLQSVETRFGRTNDEHTKTRTILHFGMWDEPFFRTLWETIRADLFGRSLTKASDMLPAMAGLAKVTEKCLLDVANHRYLAGLWSTRMSEDLSWTVLEFDAATKSIDSVPTWSWASTTAASGYIYGRPSQTFVDLIEADCYGYARPKRTGAYLKVKGFVKSLFLRVDHSHKGHHNRPSLSFWINEDSAMTTTTEETEARHKARQRASEVTSYFVLDMPICPVPHDHEAIGETKNPCLGRVPSVARVSDKQGKCDICMQKGYVSPVQLLLLTQTDLSLTTLVPTADLSQSSERKEGHVQEVNEVYKRLGLIEIDSIRKSPWVETAEGLKAPAELFWDMENPSARMTVTIV